MIRHTIMWKFAEEYGGMNKEQIMDSVISRLTALEDIISQIKAMKLEKDILHSERSYDLIYISEFDSLEALEAYRVHPEHVKVAEFIKNVRIAQAVTDTEI